MSSDLMQSVANIAQGAGTLARNILPEPAAQGVDFVDRIMGARNVTTVDISPEYRDLINKQIEIQTQLQEVTFLSNIERTNHEAKMAPVRNIRLA